MEALKGHTDWVLDVECRWSGTRHKPGSTTGTPRDRLCSTPARELVEYVSRLPDAQRPALGTRRGS